MKNKNKLVLLGASSLLLGVCLISPKPSVAHGEAETSGYATIPYSVDDIIAESVNTPFSFDPAVEYSKPLVKSEEEKDLDFYTKDENGNNIPDFFEEYYDKEIKDQYMFSVELGTIIGLASSLFALAVFIYKNSKGEKSRAKTQEQVDELRTQISELKEENKMLKETILEATETQTNQYKVAIKKTEEMSGKFENVVANLPAYYEQSAKLDKVIGALKVMSSDKGSIINGTAEKVNEILEGE